MNNKIKLSVGILLSTFILFGGLLAVATPAAALTCNDATLTGSVTVVNSPTWAKFRYSTDYNTLVNNGGTATSVQYFYNYGTYPIQAYISGLSENTTYYYRLIVHDSTGDYPANIKSFTTPYCQANNPTVSLTANPTNIQAGQPSTLTWTSTNATSCFSYWTGSTATSGSGVVYPNVTTTYTTTCYGANGTQASDTATVTVNQAATCQDPNATNYGGPLPCVYQQQNPTVNLTANPTNIQSGQSSNLSWSSQNATSCSISQLGNVSVSGNRLVYPTYTTTYTITCYGNNGTQANASATVNVNQAATCQDPNATNYGGPLPCVYQQQNPTVNLTASPTSIQSGQLSNLTWSSTNATSCFSYWTNNTATSGSGMVNPTVTTTYTTTCYGTNGTQASDSVTVYVNNNGGENVSVNLTASPSNIDSGEGSNLSWNSDNANSCSASWTGSSATDGNKMVYPTSTRTYSITCYGDSGQNSDSVTVYVNQENNTCQDYSATNYGGSLPCRYTNQNQPIVHIYATPTTTSYRGSSTITWNSNYATSCTAINGSGNWPGYKNTSGSYYASGLTMSSRTYTITCTNGYGSATDSVTVYTNRPTYNPAPVTPPTSLVLVNSSIDRNQPIVPTIDNTSPCPGDEINYAINYQNVGTGSISNLVLRLDLPYEVDYVSSNPNNPNMSGNTLVFNLGTLRANGQGLLTTRVRVRANIAAGANLNFPATLTYVDPAGNPQSVGTNISARVCGGSDNGRNLGASVFWAGFFPTNVFGWLLLIIFILILALLAKYLFGKPEQKTTTTTIH